jgi:hypothetical protein
MRNVLLFPCAAAITLILCALPASADDGRYYDDYGYYYDNDYGGRYYSEPYYDYGYRYNGGYGYRYNAVPPWSIVEDLRYQGFSYISWPALAGRFYQVKARDPNGHKVKLYIDAYSGRIVKVKG